RAIISRLGGTANRARFFVSLHQTSHVSQNRQEESIVYGIPATIAPMIPASSIQQIHSTRPFGVMRLTVNQPLALIMFADFHIPMGLSMKSSILGTIVPGGAPWLASTLRKDAHAE